MYDHRQVHLIELAAHLTDSTDLRHSNIPEWFWFAHMAADACTTSASDPVHLYKCVEQKVST